MATLTKVARIVTLRVVWVLLTILPRFVLAVATHLPYSVPLDWNKKATVRSKGLLERYDVGRLEI